MKSQPQIILHIGPSKTGTTSLQTFLHSVQETLLAQGVLYPTEGRMKRGRVYQVYRPQGLVKMSGDRAAHHLLAWTVKEEVIGLESDHCWAALLNEIQVEDPEKVVLSSESFSRASDDEVGRIAQYLADFPCRAVFYLRNPFSRVVSRFTQEVKMGRYHRSFSNFIQEEDHPEQERIIKRWSKVFGRENVVIRCFDKVKKDPGIEEDFLQILGLAPELFEDHILNVKRMNTSPPHEIVNLLRFVNILDHKIGSTKLLKRVFGKIRKKSSEGVLSRGLLAAGKPFLTKPLYQNEDRAALRAMLKSWYPEFLKNYVDSKYHSYLQV